MRYKKNDPLSEPQHAASLGHFSYVFSIFLAAEKFLGFETAHEMKYVSARPSSTPKLPLQHLS